MNATVALEACPLCRTVLHGGETRCPSCGADLTPYTAAAERVAGLTGLARQLLSQGAPEQAGTIIQQLSRIAPVPPEVLQELQARLALSRGEHATAASLAGQLPAGLLRDQLQAQAQAQAGGQARARELYNSALNTLRQGKFSLAAEQLAQAVEFDPAEARLWQLKLKADLKARLLARCYADLAALDRLGARPPELARLEALLPPALPA